MSGGMLGTLRTWAWSSSVTSLRLCLQQVKSGQVAADSNVRERVLQMALCFRHTAEFRNVGEASFQVQLSLSIHDTHRLTIIADGFERAACTVSC